jgi:hypothetical protein
MTYLQYAFVVNLLAAGSLAAVDAYEQAETEGLGTKLEQPLNTIDRALDRHRTKVRVEPSKRRTR